MPNPAARRLEGMPAEFDFIHAQLKDHVERIGILEKQGFMLDGQSTLMQTSLAENTILTKNIEQKTNDVFDILNSWRGAIKTLEGIGRFIKPFGFIAAAMTALITLYITIKSGLTK